MDRLGPIARVLENPGYGQNRINSHCQKGSKHIKGMIVSEGAVIIAFIVMEILKSACHYGNATKSRSALLS